ncbi:MAG: MMPL family transporter, partial [Candidatus Enterenecus sp.]
MSQKHKSNDSFMIKLAAFIVDKRNLFFLITAILIVFSAFSRNWVEVENDLAFYLPDNAETKLGLDIMEDQFTTFGSAEVMIANISLEDAERVADELKELEGIQSVTFDDSEDHYHNVSALYSITFDYDEDDEKCLDALASVEEALSGHDVYVSTGLGNAVSESIASEVQVIMVYVAVIVVAVLLLTSQTYAEVPVLLLTFVTAMIVNLGTNFLMGKISFVSNSVTSILQLALSLDYAVILCNRFKEEHQTLPIREAAVVALSKAIPEIGSSSLTTIGGMVAMTFMQFKIGADMAICLIKAILIALLSVFVVMPGLLVLFGPLMDRTGHRSFVPKIPFVGKFAHATRFIIPPVFVALVVLAFHFSGDCPYVYGYGEIDTPKLNHTQVAEQMIEDNFSATNFVALVVPTGDYEKEGKILAELEACDEVDYTMGLSNVEAMDGYMLADKLTPRQFAELADLDYEVAQVLYSAYAAKNGDYGQILGSISTYSVPLIDMFLFLCDQADSGIVSLDEEQSDMLAEAQEQMTNAKL